MVAATTTAINDNARNNLIAFDLFISIPLIFMYFTPQNAYYANNYLQSAVQGL
jgi:hypothetical protein